MYCTACGNLNIDTAKFCQGCGASLLKKLRAGAILDHGRYEVLKVLKPGGMSSLYLLRDHRLERPCVLKEMVPLSPDPAELKDFKDRFRLEALTLSKLSHPCIPRVFDYFEEHDQCCMVMEYIDGHDLSTMLAHAGPRGLGEETVRDWAVSICSILEYLHGQNPVILHRDLKPSNIMIRRGDSMLFLVDFGLAKSVQSAFTHRTSWGTEGYAPIEQCQGTPGVRSDLYALGATMHHLLSGNPPVPFKFERIRTLRPDVTAAMESILEKTLQLQACDRYPSAGDLRKALEGLQGLPPCAGPGPSGLQGQDGAHSLMIQVKPPVKRLAIMPGHAVIPLFNRLSRNGRHEGWPGVQQFALKAVNGDGTEEDVTSKATWHTDPGAGTIDRRGKFTAHQAGRCIREAVVKATYGKDAEASVTLGMLHVPVADADSSRHGRPGPLHGLYMAQFNVTNREFCQFLNECGNRKEGRTKWWKNEIDRYNGIIDGGRGMTPRFAVRPGYEEYPVLYVSWYGAVAFSNWLSERRGLTVCYGEFNDGGERRLGGFGYPGGQGGYRLPASAEWEFVRRRITLPGSSYYWGDCIDDRFSWHREPCGRRALAGHPEWREGSDMSGRVWEWCNERSEAGRVVRGRGWIINPALCLSWSRYDTHPSNRFHFIGFRLARAIGLP